MSFTSIFSNRHFINWPSWHIVYEWEDEISKTLNIPIRKSPISNSFAQKLLNRISLSILKYEYSALFYSLKFQHETNLCFEMIPKSNYSFSNQSSTVPIIIDYWKNYDINTFIRYYKKCPFILISSLEVFDYLTDKCQIKMIHFPLSLPDKYKLDTSTIFKKKYDILLAGRKNTLLWEYLKIYEKKYPNIEYLYETQQNGELYYCSNKNGLIGNFHKRVDYIDLLKASKVAFYSTPGIDGGEIRTGGFNPVTPRFFELLAMGCHVIARYPKNKDTDFLQLNKICPSVNSYEEFELQLNYALQQKEQPILRNAKYLNEHYTSKRVENLINILNNEK